MTDKDFRIILFLALLVAALALLAAFLIFGPSKGGVGIDPSTPPPPPDTLSQTLPITGSFFCLLTKKQYCSIPNTAI